jgi:hypothetical protein
LPAAERDSSPPPVHWQAAAPDPSPSPQGHLLPLFAAQENIVVGGAGHGQLRRSVVRGNAKKRSNVRSELMRKRKSSADGGGGSGCNRRRRRRSCWTCTQKSLHLRMGTSESAVLRAMPGCQGGTTTVHRLPITESIIKQMGISSRQRRAHAAQQRRWLHR